MRFHGGRSYAADRCATISASHRVGLALGSPALPILLTWRLARTTCERRLVKEFLRSLGWSFAFNVAWSCGELTGYLRGR
jgi:hypothetical protein